MAGASHCRRLGDNETAKTETPNLHLRTNLHIPNLTPMQRLFLHKKHCHSSSIWSVAQVWKLTAHMSTYDEPIVQIQCREAIESKHQKQFLSKWTTAVSIINSKPWIDLPILIVYKLDQRATQWQNVCEKERQSMYQPQLDFVSRTCEYAGFLMQQTWNGKGEKGT